MTFGRRFPAPQLATGAASVAGCITTDDSAALIELDVLGPNLRRRCPLTVDLAGYPDDLERAEGRTVSRRQDTVRQQHAVGHRASGDARFRAGVGFTTAIDPAVRSWPVTARSGRFTVRAP